MATAPEHLTPDEEQARREYRASFEFGERVMRSPKFRTLIQGRLLALRTRKPEVMTGEEFLARTEPPSS